MMIRLIISIISFNILFPLIIADNPCRYKNKEKGVIDITSLARKDGKAAFPDETPSLSSNYEYSYNPCKPFTEGTTCKDVAVCQVSKDKSLSFILAKHDSAKWDPGAGPGTNPSISYAYNEKNVSLELACSEKTTAEFVAIGEGPINSYKFILTHKCACWNGCKSSSGIGGGAIFIIILVVLIFVYLIVFAIYNRFRLQQSGLDLIAHRTFWVAVPVHAKDGVTYIFRRATGKGGLSYESV